MAGTATLSMLQLRLTKKAVRDTAESTRRGDVRSAGATMAELATRLPS